MTEEESGWEVEVFKVVFLEMDGSVMLQFKEIRVGVIVEVLFLFKVCLQVRRIKWVLTEELGIKLSEYIRKVMWLEGRVRLKFRFLVSSWR